MGVLVKYKEVNPSLRYADHLCRRAGLEKLDTAEVLPKYLALSLIQPS